MTVGSAFYLLDCAPYGSEKAFGLLNAAAVSIGRMEVTVGLCGDGVYLALKGQDSRPLSMPNLADILYAYGEMRVVAHEPSVLERGLFGEGLVETAELADEEAFLEAVEESDCLILL
ncbi:MAG: DrsE domain-containing protein [Methanothrix sp.]|jgi:tRNA 2-thiouridine synthesizing protein C|nr:MAG: DrsE domain-containing protein [Methanothrix sp.]